MLWARILAYITGTVDQISVVIEGRSIVEAYAKRDCRPILIRHRQARGRHWAAADPPYQRTFAAPTALPPRGKTTLACMHRRGERFNTVPVADHRSSTPFRLRARGFIPVRCYFSGQGCRLLASSLRYSCKVVLSPPTIPEPDGGSDEIHAPVHDKPDSDRSECRQCTCRTLPRWSSRRFEKPPCGLRIKVRRSRSTSRQSASRGLAGDSRARC